MTRIFVLSLVGFLGFLAADVRPVRAHGLLRWMVFTLAALALGAALVRALVPGFPPLASPSAWAGAFLAAAGAALSVYTTLVEIPLLQRLLRLPAGVMRRGTYAVCRHPGFWGLVLFVGGLSLLAPMPRVWFLALVWMALDFAVVAVQDVWVFPRVFPGYHQYRREVPFLIPTRKSLQQGCRTYTRDLWQAVP